jgi:hypothetical protein
LLCSKVMMGESTSRTAGLPGQALDLFGAPLDQFTSERNALADDLKARGLAAEAKYVRSLKKPTLSAWVTNQLARDRGPELARLLDVTDRIKEADTPDEVRDATAERHRRVRELVDAAREILEESGHAAGAGTLQQVMRTLYAAHSDADRERLAQGTLERPLESSGFDAAGGLSLEATEIEPEAGEADAERRKLEAELSEARQRATRLERAATQAQLEADAAESEAARARRLVMKLEEKLSNR